MYVPQSHSEFVKKLEQEVLELKTTAKAASLVRGFIYSETPRELGRFRINYESGTQPILTETFAYSTALSTPHDDIQYIWIFGNAYGQPLYLISNRKILSVVYDPE